MHYFTLAPKFDMKLPNGLSANGDNHTRGQEKIAFSGAEPKTNHNVKLSLINASNNFRVNTVSDVERNVQKLCDGQKHMDGRTKN